MFPGESGTEKVQVDIRVYHVPIGERGAEKVQLQITVYHVSKGKPCSYIGERGVTKSVPCSYRRKRSRDQTRQEYDLLARLRHNNIVGVSGLFSTPSSDAIVMDL